MNKKENLLYLDVIAQAIYDKKGSNILAIDVRTLSTLTDFFLIAEGNVDRHVKALALEIEKVLKEQGVTPIHIEGEREAEWIVMDYSDFVIHLFIPDLREKYRLEELWKKGKVVDLNIQIQKAS